MKTPESAVSGVLNSVGDYLEHFAHRVLQDALLEGDRLYWLRRADTFAAVGTPECDEVARACRNRAQVSPWQSRETVS